MTRRRHGSFPRPPVLSTAPYPSHNPEGSAMPLASTPSVPCGPVTAPPPAVTTKILLVRHGHAIANAEGITAGSSMCAGLTDLGYQQAQMLADRLVEEQEWRHITTVYSTSTLRTRQTAAAISALLGCAVGAELPGPNYGAADGRRWAELCGGRDQWCGGDAPLAPGAELWADMAHRGRREIEQLAHHHQGETIVVVTHHAIVSALAQSLMRAPLSRAHTTWDVGYTSLTEWHREPWTTSGSTADCWRWRLLKSNDTAHLTGNFR